MKLLIILIFAFTAYSAFCDDTEHKYYQCKTLKQVAETYSDGCNSCFRMCGEEAFQCTANYCVNGELVYQSL